MEWRTIVLDVHGIKCDTCNWRDDSVQFSEYKKYLNKKCPNCDALLLTMDDYLFTKKFRRINLIVNIIFLPLHLITYPFKRKSRKITTTLNLNGTGKMTINEKGN